MSPVVVIVARYWKYRRPNGLATAPPAPTACQSDHVASGVGLLPVRVSNTTFVPAGTSVPAVSDCQNVRLSPASKAREVNVPSVVYGLMRTQWTARLGPPTGKSLANGRRFTAGAMAWDATSTPSTKYV